MRLSRWLALIAVMVGLGLLRVSQRNAVVLKGYAVGERLHRVHAKETDVTWLSAAVGGLVSPTHLAQVAEDRRLKLVARSTWPIPSRAEPTIRLAAGDEMSD